MGTINSNTMMTLNGVAGRPEDWQGDYMSPQMMGVIAGSLQASSGLILGRRTYEEFVRYWPNADPAENPMAPLMNELPKYVVSTTMNNAEWDNTQVVSDTEALASIKASTEGVLSIIGSPTLVRSLLEAGMVDELSLMVFPTVVNDGIPLFAGTETRTKLELQYCSELPLGVLHLTYVAAA